MFSDRLFKIAFVVSSLVHALILAQSPNLKFLPSAKKEGTVQVRYIKAPKRPAEEKKVSLTKTEAFLKLSSKITADKRMPPPFIDAQGVFNKKTQGALLKPDFQKPAFVRPDITALKKKISMPAIGLDKINNPSYISYYQIVREKIRRAAYQNYSRSETGEVYLSFIISSDGYLKDTRLSEERSSSSPYLRGIALRSVKDASPFPNFPKELDYPQLSFNIVISFEIE